MWLSTIFKGNDCTFRKPCHNDSFVSYPKRVVSKGNELIPVRRNAYRTSQKIDCLAVPLEQGNDEACHCE